MSLPERGRSRQGAATTLERRCAETPFALPTFDIRSRTCARCGCVFLAYGPGVDAHMVVFGHSPEVGE